MKLNIFFMFSIVLIVTKIVTIILSGIGSEKENLKLQLSEELLDRYDKHKQQRYQRFIEGCVYGLLSSFFFAAFVDHFTKINSHEIFQGMISIGSFVIYFYYIFSKKEKLLVTYLPLYQQREAWYNVYRKMQVNTHIGVLIGLIISLIIYLL